MDPATLEALKSEFSQRLVQNVLDISNAQKVCSLLDYRNETNPFL